MNGTNHGTLTLYENQRVQRVNKKIATSSGCEKKGNSLNKQSVMYQHRCKLNVKMLLRVFCVILLTSLRSISGTTSDQNRQVVYEKCRGPGETIYSI